MILDKEAFYREVYDIVKEIPYGKVIAYGQIAVLLNRPQNARMVGHAMAYAPAGLALPCHRVVNSQGGLVVGWLEQRSLLEDEGVGFRKNGCVDMRKYAWNLLLL